MIDQPLNTLKQKILFAAAGSLIITSGLLVGLYFFDLIVCDGKCLVPDVDIEEAQRTIIELTDYDEDPCLDGIHNDTCPHRESHCAH